VFGMPLTLPQLTYEQTTMGVPTSPGNTGT
jgi:hypothetical protein